MRLLRARPRPLRRILVVADDGDIRRLNTEALTHYGYRVDAAQDGAVAWDTLQQNGYDLMVTDNELPEVTGIDLLKKLYAAPLCGAGHHGAACQPCRGRNSPAIPGFNPPPC